MRLNITKIINFLDMHNCDVNNKRSADSTADMPAVKVSRLSQSQKPIHHLEGKSPDVSVSSSSNVLIVKCRSS